MSPAGALAQRPAGPKEEEGVPDEWPEALDLDAGLVCEPGADEALPVPEVEDAFVVEHTGIPLGARVGRQGGHPDRVDLE
jgi:hypothetical protein